MNKKTIKGCIAFVVFHVLSMAYLFGQNGVGSSGHYLSSELVNKGVPESIIASWSQLQLEEKIEFTQHWESILNADEETGSHEHVSSSTVAAACDNIGFENGNFTNWTRTTGSYTACCPNPGGAQTVVSSGLDPYGHFSVRNPSSTDGFSVKLGNTSVGAIADQLEFQFVVSQSNKFVEYNYAVVFEEPGHPIYAQPKFESAFYKNGVEIPCSKFEATAASNLPGFFQSDVSPRVLYKPWSRVVVDLSNYVGDTILVKFTNRDCDFGAHFGYSYLDASCLSDNAIDVTACSGEICAPSFYGNVKWTGHGYVDHQAQCIPRPSKGTYQYRLDRVNVNSSCPEPPLYYNVTVTSNVDEYVENGSLEKGQVPSIEILPGLEIARGQVNRVQDWMRATGDPDLFDIQFKECLPSQLPSLNLCGLSPLDATCVGIPCNHFGYQDHRLRQDSGRYVGLYQAIGVDFDPLVPIRQRNILRNLFDERVIVEGAQTKLIEALDTSQLYEFNMYASRAEKGEEGTDLLLSESAYFVVKMGMNQVSNELLLYDQTDADIVYAGKVSDTLNWENINFDFKVEKPYEWLVIESYPAGFVHELFKDDVLLSNVSTVKLRDSLYYYVNGALTSPTWLVNELSKIPRIQSYMYFDDVSIRLKCVDNPSTLIADAGADQYFCSSSGIGILGGLPAASGGVAPYYYNWSEVTDLDDAFQANPQVTAFETKQYTLTVVDAVGNIATDDVWVYVGGIDVDAGGDIDLCLGSCGVLNRAQVSNGSGTFSYSWTSVSGSNNISAPNNLSTQVCVSSAVNEFRLTVVDNVSGCSDNDVLEVSKSGGASELVANGEFTSASVPTLRGQVDLAQRWNASTGSPDLFHEYVSCFPVCADHNNVGIPSNHFGNKNHIRPGTAVYSGVYTNIGLERFHGGGVNLELFDQTFALNVAGAHPMFNSESIYQILDQNLDNQKTYTIELDAGLARNGEINRDVTALTAFQTQDVQLSNSVYVLVYFSNEKFDDNLPKLLIPEESQIVLSQPINRQMDWYHLSATFRPSRDWSTLVVLTVNKGAVKGGVPGVIDIPGNNVTLSESFTYLDNISIKQTCGTSLPASIIVKPNDNSLVSHLLEVEKELQFSINASAQPNRIEIISRKSETENLNYVLRDVSGVEIQKGSVSANGQINHHLSSGIYLLEVLNGGNASEVHRVLIE